MYTGFSAAMVRPQTTGPQEGPRFKLDPSMIFKARRKNTGGLMRASCVVMYCTSGRFGCTPHTARGVSTATFIYPPAFHSPGKMPASGLDGAVSEPP